MEHIFHTLREANEARNIEWTKGQSIEDYTWRGTELGGEIGEVCELLQLPDVWDRKDDLADELADGVICIDLAGMTLKLPPFPIFAAGSIAVGGLVNEARYLAVNMLKLLNDFKKLERERRGWAGSRVEPGRLDNRLRYLMGRLGTVASYCKIDLTAATEAKFNLTSTNVGLATRLHYRRGPYEGVDFPRDAIDAG